MKSFSSLSLLLPLAISAAILIPEPAHAQSCSTMVTDRMNWVAAGGGNYLNVTGTSINASGSSGYGLVSYVQGFLDQYQAAYWYYDYLRGTWVLSPARTWSHANYQSFSDRYATGSQPFNKNAKDQLGITLDGNGKIVITLDSWGGGSLNVTAASCANDVIYGFSSDGTLWAFVLKKTWLG